MQLTGQREMELDKIPRSLPFVILIGCWGAHNLGLTVRKAF